MASATYTARCIVLRKTKLGESDLILTLLAEDGSQVRAVAKGARKPTSTFAARLELYSVADILCAKGRNLDIVKEARLLDSNEHLRRDIEHAACAAPMAELLDKVTQMGLENPRLFALTRVALLNLNTTPTPAAPALCAAHLLKTLAFSGLRPSFSICVGCGANIALSKTEENVVFSYHEGGVVCLACRETTDVVLVSSSTLGWCTIFLSSTFQEIAAMEVPPSASFAVLRFAQMWIQEHVGAQLKSLIFLFTSGLF